MLEMAFLGTLGRLADGAIDWEGVQSRFGLALGVVVSWVASYRGLPFFLLCQCFFIQFWGRYRYGYTIDPLIEEFTVLCCTSSQHTFIQQKSLICDEDDYPAIRVLEGTS